MLKLYGLIFASALMCAGSAQAFPLNARTPPIMHLNPQPLPPGLHRSSGGGAGKVMRGVTRSPIQNGSDGFKTKTTGSGHW